MTQFGNDVDVRGQGHLSKAEVVLGIFCLVVRLLEELPGRSRSTCQSVEAREVLDGAFPPAIVIPEFKVQRTLEGT
jgi:hypothetical protein